METIKSIVQRLDIEIHNRYDLNNAVKDLENGTIQYSDLEAVFNRIDQRTQQAKESIKQVSL